jgi:hypothetical protein
MPACAHEAPSQAILPDSLKIFEIHGLVGEMLAQMGGLDVVVSNHGWTRVWRSGEMRMSKRTIGMSISTRMFVFRTVREHLHKPRGAFISTVSLREPSSDLSTLSFLVSYRREYQWPHFGGQDQSDSCRSPFESLAIVEMKGPISGLMPTNRPWRCIIGRHITSHPCG